MDSQYQIFQENWRIFSEKMMNTRPSISNKDLIYQGRKFYDDTNPPFLAAVVKVSAHLWTTLQQIQGELDRTDNRQTYFHPNYFHITINEVGWQDQINVDNIIIKLKKIAKQIDPFDIQIRGINCFDRIIFAQVFDEQGMLESMFNKTFEEFPKLEKHFPSYIPHISLVKIDTTEARDIIRVISDKYREVEIGIMHVKEIQLVAARPYLSAGRIETMKKIQL